MTTDPTEASRPWWALVIAVLAMLFLGYLAADAGAEQGQADDDEAEMLTVARGGELAFDEIPADQQGLYLAAEQDPEAFQAVRCDCGCEDFLDHPDLRACFLRADGGWEAHATGCGICLAQAEMVRDLREEGLPLDDVIDAVDDRYASTIPS